MMRFDRTSGRALAGSLFLALALAPACDQNKATTVKAQALCSKWAGKLKECSKQETAKSTNTSAASEDKNEKTVDVEKIYDAFECFCKKFVELEPPIQEFVDDMECELSAPTCEQFTDNDFETSCEEKAGLCLNAPVKKGQECDYPDEERCLKEEIALRKCEDDRTRKDCNNEDDALDLCKKKAEEESKSRLGCTAKEDLEECEERISGETWKACGGDPALFADTSDATGETQDEGKTSDKTSSDYCGNGKIEKTRGEECDGTLLDDATCASLGFSAGNLRCTYSCKLDKSGCKGCGNGSVEKDIGEECEPAPKATSSSTADSASTSSTSGTTSTSSSTSGLKLDKTCADLGFLGGNLGCTKECKYDNSTCAGGKLLYSINGYSDSSGFGSFVRTAGDVNGDGKTDLLILSSKPSHPKGCPTGALGLLSLRSGSDGSEISYSCFSAPTDVKDLYLNPIYGSSYGSSSYNGNVLDAGDVNGDGVRDFAVYDSQTDFPVPASDAGTTCKYNSDCKSGAKCLDASTGYECYVGYSSTPTCNCAKTVPYADAPILVAYSGRDGSVLTILGKGEPAIPGTPIGSVGDITGDGKGEFVFSTYQSSTSSSVKTTGLAAYSLASAQLVFLTAYLSGNPVPFLDFNKDGRADFILSDSSANSHPSACPGPITSRGVISVVSGADGKDLQVICGELDGDSLSYTGHTIDANGDGAPDLLVYRKGNLGVVSGKDGKRLWETKVTSPNAAALSDLNSDGVADVLAYSISASSSSYSSSYGSSYGSSIVSGKTGDVLATLDMAKNKTVAGVAAADLNADGTLEVILGIPSENAAGLTGSGSVLVYSVDPLPKSKTAIRRFTIRNGLAATRGFFGAILPGGKK